MDKTHPARTTAGVKRTLRAVICIFTRAAVCAWGEAGWARESSTSPLRPLISESDTRSQKPKAAVHRWISSALALPSSLCYPKPVAGTVSTLYPSETILSKEFHSCH